MSCFVLGRYALAARSRKPYLMLGRWDWVFGAWQADRAGGPFHVLTPAWPLLTKDGLTVTRELLAAARHQAADADHVDRRKVRDNRAELGCLEPSDRMALDSYLDLIPAAVRRLAGPYGIFQWVLLDAVAGTPGFAAFAQTAADTNCASFITACWILAGAGALRRETRIKLNQAILYEKRTALLTRLAGFEVSDRALQALYKLQPTTMSREVIKRVQDVSRDPQAAARIDVAHRLSEPLLEAIALLPTWLGTPPLIRCLSTLDDDELDLGIMSELQRLALTTCPAQKQQIAASLATARTGNELANRLATVSQRLTLKRSFPAPPLPGDASLRPLSSGQLLRAESRRMSNCAIAYADAILSGERYLYGWHDDETATVELVQDGRGFWTLGSFAGVRNGPVSLRTIGEIVANLLRKAAAASREDKTAARERGQSDV